jgi:IS5 family transposase
MLKAGTVVDATLIAAPTSTKNTTGERDPDIHQSNKGNQWYFGGAPPAQLGTDRDGSLEPGARCNGQHSIPAKLTQNG